MIRRRLWVSLVGIVVIAVVAVATNLVARNEPVLGLDLQGGVSVVLSAEAGSTGDDLIVIRDLIRDELESRGIAEPDVRVEGDNIIVDLPGVRDQREALEAADVAGIVSLRPVLSPCAPAVDETAPATTEVMETTDPSATSEPAETTDVAETTDGASGFRRPASGDTEPETSAPESTEPGDSTEPPATTEPATTTTTEPPLGPLGENPYTTYPPTPYGPPAPPAEDTVTDLQDRDDNTCTVGPVQRSPEGDTGGLAFRRGSASALIDPTTGGWMVTVGLTAEGRTTFNDLALQCFQRSEDCPTGQLAIVLDDTVQSAPVVQQASFEDTVQITGTFSESEARSLARVLNRGAFPVDVHTETVQTVSPTLGEDSLRAAIFAGLVGIVLVLAMLSYFYRRFAVVVVAGLAVWGLLIYSAAAIISQATNFALSLAGATGIIVAIGITVDSYVVYFERLKEEVRHGRTVRNGAARAFRASWRTILAADFVGLIAAVVLFALSVGSVRGFALYLGVTTVCDLIVLFFFTRPAVGLLGGSGWLDRGNTFGLKEVT